MSFPRYPSYRDSGVEWLGPVPDHWETVPVKRCLTSITQGWSPQCESYPADGQQWGVLKVGCVNGGKFDPSENKALPEDLEPIPALSIRKGDVLISRANTRELVGSVAVVERDHERLLLCDKLYRLRVDSQHCDAAFLASSLSTSAARGVIEAAASGASNSMLNMGQAAITGMFIALPPLQEQQAVLAFLDRETAKIDALVEEQKRLIELLKEKRQAVISQAVTKGLDPNVPMKDSGVEWLGSIPAHWEAVALKRVSPVQTVGIVVNPSLYVASEGSPFLYGGDIQEGRIDLAGCRRISPEDSDRSAKTRLRAGDLVTVRVGAPGVTAVVPPEADGGNCASVMLIRRGDFDSRWLCYTMNDRVVRFQVEVVQYGAAQEQFNISHAVEFTLPRPNRDEQTLIADHLDKETARIDELVAEAEAAMRLLGERRSALISAAVTGKVDVRGSDDLVASWAEAAADIAAGRFVVESSQAHLARIRAMISRDG